MASLSGMDEITNYYECSANTIRNLVKEKNFPAVKIGGGWESDSGLIDKWRVWFILEKHNPSGSTIDLYAELMEVMKNSQLQAAT